jgi:hypothetical protein
MKKYLSMSMASMLASSVPVCLVTLMTTPVVVSAQVLDQGFQPTGQLISIGTSSDRALAQTFTVGVSGMLTRFDAYVAGGPVAVSVIWEIRPTINGVPVESATASLASGTFLGNAASQNWSFYTVNLASPIPVSTGEVLAIDLRTPPGYNGVSISWEGERPDPYTGGYAFVGTPVGIPDPNATAWATSTLAGYDLGFRTYVEPVPEPSVAFLFFVGVCAVLHAASRRYRLIALDV